MFKFTTASDTTWKVENGRITRIPSPYIPPEVAFARCQPIEAVPFRWVEAPKVGKQAFFRLVGDQGISHTGVITSITPGEFW